MRVQACVEQHVRPACGFVGAWWGVLETATWPSVVCQKHSIPGCAEVVVVVGHLCCSCELMNMHGGVHAWRCHSGMHSVCVCGGGACMSGQLMQFCCQHHQRERRSIIGALFVLGAWGTCFVLSEGPRQVPDACLVIRTHCTIYWPWPCWGQVSRCGMWHTSGTSSRAFGCVPVRGENNTFCCRAWCVSAWHFAPAVLCHSFCWSLAACCADRLVC